MTMQITNRFAGRQMSGNPGKDINDEISPYLAGKAGTFTKYEYCSNCPSGPR